MISIPFGTIKSSKRKPRNRKNCISIPFGTIKSLIELTSFLKSSEFQFHLVRLKERISQVLEFMKIFQFHLVRLKDACERQGQNAKLFQFHLVRLKEPVLRLYES